MSLADTMAGADLRAWRKDEGLTQVQAADRLGISVRSLITYEARDAEVPRVVALALIALQLGAVADSLDDMADSATKMGDALVFVGNQIRARLGRSTAQPQESDND